MISLLLRIILTPLTAKIGEGKGKKGCLFTGLAMSNLSEETVLKSFKWWDKVQQYPSIRDCAYLVFELFCTVSRNMR